MRRKSEIHLLSIANKVDSPNKCSSSRSGIDIKDFKLAIDVVTHRGADVGLHSTGWNTDWRAFIARIPSHKEVFDFAKEMVNRYAID